MFMVSYLYFSLLHNQTVTETTDRLQSLLGVFTAALAFIFPDPDETCRHELYINIVKKEAQSEC